MQGVQAGFETTEGEGSFFRVGNVDNSLGSLLILFPEGIITTLFRPFLFEARNPLMLMSSLEATGFLILTIMLFSRTGFFRTFRFIFSDSVLVFCFMFVILFAGFNGISTFNFGSLSRYKIPCLPYYLMLLFIVGYKAKTFSSNYIFRRNFF